MTEAKVDAKHLARPFLPNKTTSQAVLVMVGTERACFCWKVVRKSIDDKRGYAELTEATREDGSAVDQQFWT